ncbi:unnamed protein product [Meloidogyne enterolobii]|uniref:Uncharacterized protein n=1 Tax=Meloidogyne enterolobii TaxID=390850 RepID=A0ACB0YGD2_MELEN
MNGFSLPQLRKAIGVSYTANSHIILKKKEYGAAQNLQINYINAMVKDPMFSLPNDVRLDILKCLNFNQLFSQRQTNFYFCNLINKHEEQLAKKKFNRLVNVILSDKVFQSAKMINLQSGLFRFTLNDQLRKKWNAALATSIHLYLHHSTKQSPILVRLEKIENEIHLLLDLPAFPKNIKDLVTLRCWFEHLSGCAFKHLYCGYRFNPELIRLLFDDDETIPHQFLA